MNPWPDWDIAPKTFNGMLAAARAQADYVAKYGYTPEGWGVTVTAGAVADLFEVVADLRARVALLEGEAL